MTNTSRIEAAIIEAKTDDRKGLPVVDLEYMALTGDETPVSGDALKLYS